MRAHGITRWGFVPRNRIGSSSTLYIGAVPNRNSPPATAAPRIEKLKQRFQLDRVVLVGDCGMISSSGYCTASPRESWPALSKRASPRTSNCKSGLDHGMHAPAVKELLNSGALQLSLFDQPDTANIASLGLPGERLIVCRNPDLAAETHAQA
jgi:hypothetical protein